MPIYEYLCEKCDEVFTEHFLIKDLKRELPCPKCGLMSQKIISTFGLYEIKGNNSASTPPKSRLTKKD